MFGIGALYLVIDLKGLVSRNSKLKLTNGFTKKKKKGAKNISCLKSFKQG